VVTHIGRLRSASEIKIESVELREKIGVCNVPVAVRLKPGCPNSFCPRRIVVTVGRDTKRTGSVHLASCRSSAEIVMEFPQSVDQCISFLVLGVIPEVDSSTVL
jgi:hypothetical protein